LERRPRLARSRVVVVAPRRSTGAATTIRRFDAPRRDARHFIAGPPARFLAPPPPRASPAPRRRSIADPPRSPPTPSIARPRSSQKGDGGAAKTQTEDILNSILPPREHVEDGTLWVQYVAPTPATRLDVINLQEKLDARLQARPVVAPRRLPRHRLRAAPSPSLQRSRPMKRLPSTSSHT